MIHAQLMKTYSYFKQEKGKQGRERHRRETSPASHILQSKFGVAVTDIGRATPACQGTVVVPVFRTVQEDLADEVPKQSEAKFAKSQIFRMFGDFWVGARIATRRLWQTL